MRFSSFASSISSWLIVGLGLVLVTTGCDSLSGSGGSSGLDRALVRVQNDTGEPLTNVQFLLSESDDDPAGSGVTFNRTEMPDLAAGETSEAFEVDLGPEYLEIGIDAWIGATAELLATTRNPTFEAEPYRLTVTATSALENRLHHRNTTKEAGGSTTEIRVRNASDRPMNDIVVEIPKVYDGEGRPEVDVYTVGDLAAGQTSAYLEVPRTVGDPEFEVSTSATETLYAGMLDTPYYAEDFNDDGQYTYTLEVVKKRIYTGSASLEKE